MTTYRVGPEGATVFDEDGAVLCRLRPGQVVVPGDVALPGTDADKHRVAVAGKRVRHYPDKKLRPSADKATPPRQADPRLRNPLAGTG